MSKFLMLPSACGLGQYFQARGHSFSLKGLPLSRNITYLFFPSLSQVISVTSVYLFHTTSRVRCRDRDQRLENPDRAKDQSDYVSSQEK